MGTYLALFCGILFIWILAFVANGREIMSPASLVCVMFAFSCALSVFGYGKWNTFPLSIETLTVLLLGCMAFTVGGAASYNRPYRKTIYFHDHEDLSPYKQYDYVINPWKIVFLVFVLAIVGYVRIRLLYRTARDEGYNYSSFAGLTRWYRQSYSALFGPGSVRLGVGGSLLEKQILKLEDVLPVVAVVMILLSVSSNNRKTLLLSSALLLILAVYSLTTSGGRGTILFWGVSLIYGLYIISIKHGIKIRTVNCLFVFAGVIIVLVLLPVFYYSSAIVGRKSNGDMLDYLSFYWGCGIPSFEIALRNGIQDHPIAHNVFYGVYTLLYKLEIVNELNGYANEWVDLNGYLSNVYTAWYRYYADFGLFGVSIFAFFYGYAATWLYQRVKYGNSIVELCIFCRWGYSLFDLNRDDYLFGQFINTNEIIKLLLTIVFTVWLVRPIVPKISFKEHLKLSGYEKHRTFSKCPVRFDKAL